MSTDGIAKKIFTGGLAVSISTKGFHTLSGQRKVNNMTLRDGQGEKLPEAFFQASKRKVESSDALNKVMNKLGAIRRVPPECGLEIYPGIYIIPKSRIESAVSAMRVLREELIELWVDYLNNHYANDVSNSAQKLGKRFKETDYPPKDRLLGSYEVNYRFLELNVPDSLKDLDELAYNEQVKQVQKEVEDFTEFARAALRTELEEVLQRMLSAVSPGIDGRRKGKVTTNVLESFNNFYRRAQELAFCANEAGELFCERGCKISVQPVLDPEITEDELPNCPKCGTQLARNTVLNYAHRIRRIMEGNGVQYDNINKGTAALKEAHVRILLNTSLTKLATEAEATMELQSSKRFIKRRKKGSTNE